MSMTKNEFRRRYRRLREESDPAPPYSDKVIALVEEAGITWDPEPTPEPTGDLSMVRVIDAEGIEWKCDSFPTWVRVDADHVERFWSEIPQPVTVLHPREERA